MTEILREELTILSSIATVAWCAAEAGELDTATYADVFEHIARELRRIVDKSA